MAQQPDTPEPTPESDDPAAAEAGTSTDEWMHTPLDPWRSTVVRTLRERGIPGGPIGTLLAEVDARCAQSSETPDELFGPAEDFADARAVGLTPVGAPLSRSVVSNAALQGLSLLLGLMLLVAGLAALVDGGRASITVGAVVGALLGGAALAIVVTRIATLTATSLRGALTLLGLIAVVALPALLLTKSFVEVPAIASFFAGLVLLALAVVPLLTRRRG